MIKREEIAFEKFAEYLILEVIEKSSKNKDNYYLIENKTFNFSVDLSFNYEFLAELSYNEKLQGPDELILQSLLLITEKQFKFRNCHFLKISHSYSLPKQNFEFDHNCIFKEVNFKNSHFGGKLKFWNCTFQKTNFYNTKFSDLADFYNCTFNKKVIFFKTDFKGTTVFSASTFKENVLFTYALIEKLVIFRGTRFKHGLDLSCAIIPGEMTPFDIDLGDFEPKIITSIDYIDLDSKKYNTEAKRFEKVYSDCITKKGLIPIKNQRETYRIIKEAFVKREDIASSIKFKVLEKETLRNELSLVSNEQNFFNRINLWFNWVSNRHSDSYIQALGFTTVIGLIFYSASLLSIFCEVVCKINGNEGFDFLVINFIKFMNPTHSFAYLGEDSIELSKGFYFFDFWGRIFVGYGIYQFIQAFRKYR